MQTAVAAQSMRARGKRYQEWHRVAGRLLMRWHLCSLDAPTVAVVWALAIARSAGVHLSFAELLVLAQGTWIVYVLDRVLDGTRGRAGGTLPSEGLQERHYFHRRHRRVLLALCVLSAASTALLCCRLPPRLVAFYLLLGVPVSAYALRVHGPLLQGRLRRKQAEGFAGTRKEAAVAILFSAAVAAPAWTTAGVHAMHPAELVFPALLLAPLCWVNCVLISHAEAPEAEPRRLPIGVCAAALACAAAASCLASLVWGHGGAEISAEAAVLVSSLLLLRLALAPRAYSPEHGSVTPRGLRVLADLALLTPLLLELPRLPHF